MGHTQKKRFIVKEIYQKSSYGSDVASETYPPPSPITKHPELFNPLPLDVIYGWPYIISFWLTREMFSFY